LTANTDRRSGARLYGQLTYSGNGVRRIRFFSNLAALAVSLVLIAAVGFPAGALNGIGLGFGIAGLAVSLWYSALMVHERPLEGTLDLRLLGRRFNVWRLVSGAIAVLSVWEIIAVAVFNASVSRWLTLANGILIACLSVGGLIAHEYISERIVHVLEIVERPRQDPI
jgi:hypothetical protein